MWMRMIRMFLGVPNENFMVTEHSFITLSRNWILIRPMDPDVAFDLIFMDLS
jgi:hypothetical protein